jgi:hypothetical protein
MKLISRIFLDLFVFFLQINEQLTNIKKQYKDQKDKCDEKWRILEQEMNLFEQRKRANMETMKKGTKKK